ncbi:TPA: hypothetical protein OMS07_000382 [Klebsiella aerogenes]|nr:hypothetical protein [Klebsiella aerogenes]HBS5677263.1 hypothetical protein [Klebsiella aerogenes]HCR0140502.1 hypothetical protein [Klebsiella aerogenes]HCU2332423.1 hypothetical protein [Klebsiella aerogenes]HDS6595594.1 hypothetical protein [Klebsiella aerogenes]
MGRTSAGLHERDADCGIELRDRTTRRIRRKTLVHYLVSPPHCPETGQRQAKAIHIEQLAKPPLCNRVLNPAGSGVTRWASCAFLMSRARRFIPRSGVKCKIKIRVLPELSGKISTTLFPLMRAMSKKCGNAMKF